MRVVACLRVCATSITLVVRRNREFFALAFYKKCFIRAWRSDTAPLLSTQLDTLVGARSVVSAKICSVSLTDEAVCFWSPGHLPTGSIPLSRMSC